MVFYLNGALWLEVCGRPPWDILVDWKDWLERVKAGASKFPTVISFRIQEQEIEIPGNSQEHKLFFIFHNTCEFLNKNDIDNKPNYFCDSFRGFFLLKKYVIFNGSYYDMVYY